MPKICFHVISGLACFHHLVPACPANTGERRPKALLTDAHPRLWRQLFAFCWQVPCLWACSSSCLGPFPPSLGSTLFQQLCDEADDPGLNNHGAPPSKQLSQAQGSQEGPSPGSCAGIVGKKASPTDL